MGGMTNVEGIGAEHGFMFYAWVGKLSGQEYDRIPSTTPGAEPPGN